MLSPLTDGVNSGIINTKILANHTLSNIHIDATDEFAQYLPDQLPYHPI